MLPDLREPWRSFLHDVDARVRDPVALHCLGGFVVTVLHGLPRPIAKLERNLQRDRDDVLYLARAAHLDLDLLRKRYSAELRPYLGRPEREDLTLKLWIEMIHESRGT